MDAARPGTAPCPGARRVRTGPLAAAMCLCVALVVGMVSAINLAIPALATGPPRPSADALLWIVDGYVVVFACLLVPAGALADRRGRKGTLLCGMGLFALGTLLCALSPGVAVLLCGRVLSGVGAAAVLPTTLALLVDAAPAAARQRMIGVWASMTGVAAVLGNVGGGAAVQLGGWRALFWIAAPLGVVAVLATAFAAPRVPRHDRPVPVVATGLLTAGVVAVLFALVSAPRDGWADVRVIGGFAAGALLLAGWALRELGARRPLLDPRVFAARGMRGSALGMAIVFVGMFGLMYCNGQYLQYAKGYTVLGAGVRLLPMAAGLMIAPRAGVALVRWAGARVTVAAAVVTLVAGLGTASLVDASTPYGWYAVAVVLTATGCGLATPPLSHGIMAALPASRAGLGSGLQSVTRELGSSLGVAIVGSVLNSRFLAGLPAALRGGAPPTTVAEARARTGDPDLAVRVVSDFTHSMGTALRTAAIVVLAAGVFVVLWLPRRDHETTG